ncbi:MAG: rRNA maturation RNase YbeY [Bacteroidetes bacterium HGW-Bacteroidetes-1]|jgi:rRNA maturation RNase YbeY|nr:MAG: rRNA maturation RNase YbeY [Bacteroidetes bacterium HGW-Bacteroidetes-1]
MIHFLTIDIELPINLDEKVIDWLEVVLKQYRMKTGEVFFLFCSDEYLYKMNLQYLGHDTYTDIITFDLSESSEYISGEIYISLDRVNENATRHDVSLVDELHRVMVHGILHLLGFKDKTEIDEMQMRHQEEICLSLRT